MIALRRLVTVPFATALSVCVLVLSPLLLAGGALVAVATRSTRPARTVGLGDGVRLHRTTHAGEACGRRRRRRSAHDATSSTRPTPPRAGVLDVEVVLDPSSASPESIPRDEPVIVLSRHCGPGDSVLVAWLLMFSYRLRVRIVLKAILRYEPVLDFAGQRGMPVLPGPRRPRPSTDSRSRRIAGRRAGAAALSRRGELHLAAVAHRDRRTTQDRPDPRGRTRATTLLYAAAARRRRHCCGERSAQRQCPGTHPQRLLPRRAGTAVVAAAGPPAIACPHDPHPGCPTSRTRPAEPMAGTNLDKGRRLGRRPHRGPDRITDFDSAGCT